MKLILALLVGLAVVPLFAATVVPTSNILGDTAATASTLVFRDTNGVFDAASLQDLTVVTAKIIAAAVTTPKLNLADQTSSRVACITTTKTIGTCNGLALTGVCGNCQ